MTDVSSALVSSDSNSSSSNSNSNSSAKSQEYPFEINLSELNLVNLRKLVIILFRQAYLMVDGGGDDANHNNNSHDNNGNSNNDNDNYINMDNIEKEKWLPNELRDLIVQFCPRQWSWYSLSYSSKTHFSLDSAAFVRIEGRTGRCVANHYIAMTKNPQVHRYQCFQLTLHKISNASNIGFVSYPVEGNYAQARPYSTEMMGKREIWWNTYLGYQPGDFCLGVSNSSSSFSKWHLGGQPSSFRTTAIVSGGVVVSFCVDVHHRTCQMWIGEESIGIVFDDLTDTVVPCVSNYEDVAEYTIKWIDVTSLPTLPIQKN